jgi:hypothetical protein
MGQKLLYNFRKNLTSPQFGILGVVYCRHAGPEKELALPIGEHGTSSLNNSGVLGKVKFILRIRIGYNSQQI